MHLFPPKSSYQINDLTYNQWYLINKEIRQNTVTLGRYLLIPMMLPLSKNGIFLTFKKFHSWMFTLRQLIYFKERDSNDPVLVLLPLCTWAAANTTWKPELKESCILSKLRVKPQRPLTMHDQQGDPSTTSTERDHKPFWSEIVCITWVSPKILQEGNCQLLNLGVRGCLLAGRRKACFSAVVCLEIQSSPKF